MITRGIESSAKGMMSLIDHQDVLAHNLANVNTVGFKKTHITFRDLMQTRLELEQVPAENNPKDTQFKRVGSLSLGNVTDRTYIDFSQGGLIETGNKLDLALQGEGFFKIRYNHVKDNEPYNEKNYYYARAGNFKLTDQHYLVNQDGDYVMDVNNRRIRITFNPEEDTNDPNNRIDPIKDIAVNENGLIQVTNPDNPATLQQIQIVDFQDKTKVSTLGEGKFLQIEGMDAGMYTKTEGFAIQQGMLEASNTNVIKEMINNISVSRSYETMAKIIKTQGDTVSKAIDLGVIRG